LNFFCKHLFLGKLLRGASAPGLSLYACLAPTTGQRSKHYQTIRYQHTSITWRSFSGSTTSSTNYLSAMTPPCTLLITYDDAQVPRHVPVVCDTMHKVTHTIKRSNSQICPK